MTAKTKICATCRAMILKEPFSQMTLTMTMQDDSRCEIVADVCGKCAEKCDKWGYTIRPQNDGDDWRLCLLSEDEVEA